MPSIASIDARARVPTVLEPGALVADDDALLGVALDVEVRVHVEQRLVLGPVRSQPHLVDHDRDRVRELVADAVERGLADQVGDHQLLGRVGELAVGVQRRPLGQQPDQQVGQQLDLVPRHGRDRDDLGPLVPVSSPSRAMSSRCSPIRCGVARSVLVATATFVVRRTLAISVTMNRSPGPIFSSLGKQTATTSTSAHVVRTRSLSRSPSRVRGRCSPGVSTRISWASSRCTMPRTTVRVVCGLSEVITIFEPTSALVRVDLPALGRPTKDAILLRQLPLVLKLN